SCPALLQQIIGSLNNEFDMTGLGVLNYFLGISADRTPTGLFLSQKKYALQLFDRAHMVTCNPSRTPVDTESKLGPEGAPLQDPTLYRSLAGGLQYLTFTRPDLSYAVQQICLYMHDPREPHLAALKRILRYVQGTLDLGLRLYASSTTSLVGYTDADWAGCPSTCRSTSGYCVFLSDNLLSWSAKRQHTLSRSSSEAEYRGVANVVAETAWLRNLLRELHSPLSTVTLVYCDNVSAIYMSANPVQHQRTKHIEIDIHFVLSSEIWLPLVKLEFYMCLLVSNMPIFSPKDCLPHCLKNFDPVCPILALAGVNANGHLLIRLFKHVRLLGYKYYFKFEIGVHLRGEMRFGDGAVEIEDSGMDPCKLVTDMVVTEFSYGYEPTNGRACIHA
ncbi:ribonuclease H-like domain-containing protein, partial [Tanacetum coccineum]